MEANYPILEWRIGLRQSGISDLGCPRMEEVLRAPAAHGVSSKTPKIFACGALATPGFY